MTAITAYLTPARRRWLYAIATAGLLLLGTYGVLNGSQIAAWNYLVAAITGMATANTDPRTASGAPLDETAP